MITQRSRETRPQKSLKAAALPEALWRSGAYFAPGAIGRRRGGHAHAGVPAPDASWPGVFAVLADEVVLAGFKITRDPPTDEAWERIEHEVSAASDLFAQRGWLDDPTSYHRSPAAPADMSVTSVRKWEGLGLGWEQLRWASEWLPNAGEPGRDRWRSYERNSRASAWLLRHRDDTPRHWAVLIHGTEQGRLLVDQQIFRARYLHNELGCNVVMPLLPLHASRRPPAGLGSGFPTLDVLDNVHGLAQSAYDIRCLLRWIATQAALSVSVTGLSLGGGVAALVAGLEPEIGAVVGLVPAVDFPEVFRRQSPRHMRRSDEFLHLHAASKTLHEVVSPLSFRPATAPAQLHILAGIHDRLLDPLSQAARLAEHWGTTNVTWVDRGHVTHMGSGGVIATLEHAITAAPNLPAGV